MSKKRQQKERRRRRQQRRQRLARTSLEALKRRIQEEGISEGREVVFGASSSEKMSEVLLEFVKPYLEAAKTQQSFERLIAFGALAWNAARIPPEDQQSLLDEISESMAESASKEHVETVRELLRDLIERKERYFADNKRLIAGYEVTEGEDEFHLAVASRG